MDHEKSYMLKKAIDELPAYVAPERVWAGIESEIVPEQNREVLEKALHAYKSPVPSPVSWEALAGRIAEDPASWSVTGNSRTKAFPLPRYGYWVSGIAAAVVVAICIGIYVGTKNDPGSYAERGKGYGSGDMEPVASALVPEASEEEALRFIDRFCKGQNVVCTSEAFLELKAALDESTAELNEISKELSVFQNDPELLHAKATIEKYRATVLKEITLMI